ncbi:MAG TPA: cation:proton antiporter [Chromatiaceae bacterium]|nr:cation:proton antiporter [Chromatiaceae bacterium]
MQDDAGVPPLGMAHHAFVFFVCLLLWMLLVGTLDLREWLAGAVVAALVTLLFAPRFSIFTGFRFGWLAPLHILRYLAAFFVDLVVANYQLAKRILTPSLPIRPEIVEVHTRLRSPLGRMLLANSITLTPGTLTVDVQDDRLLVHWVYAPPGVDSERATALIAAATEKRLSRFLW